MSDGSAAPGMAKHSDLVTEIREGIGVGLPGAAAGGNVNKKQQPLPVRKSLRAHHPRSRSAFTTTSSGAAEEDEDRQGLLGPSAQSPTGASDPESGGITAAPLSLALQASGSGRRGGEAAPPPGADSILGGRTFARLPDTLFVGARKGTDTTPCLHSVSF